MRAGRSEQHRVVPSWALHGQRPWERVVKGPLGWGRQHPLLGHMWVLLPELCTQCGGFRSPQLSRSPKLTLICKLSVHDSWHGANCVAGYFLSCCLFSDPPLALPWSLAVEHPKVWVDSCSVFVQGDLVLVLTVCAEGVKKPLHSAPAVFDRTLPHCLLMPVSVTLAEKQNNQGICQLTFCTTALVNWSENRFSSFVLLALSDGL